MRRQAFVRARNSDGKFREPFDPAVAGNGDYTEGNAWQYSWYAPQDTAELIRRMGGDRRFVKKLDTLFDSKVDPASFANVEDISGLIGFYAHGNEPSHHIGYLYVYAGAPWRTQQRLAQIVSSQYQPTPDGLAGNDDLGQMSAWLLFTSFGFYPVTPGSGEYVIGRPFVNRAVLHLPNGKQFTISVDNLSDANGYVGSVRLNGKPLDSHVHPSRGDHGRGRVAFRDAGEAEYAVGDGSRESAVLAVDGVCEAVTPCGSAVQYVRARRAMRQMKSERHM